MALATDGLRQVGGHEKSLDDTEQVLYLGRYVPRDYFRAYVYRENEQVLATSYDDFLAKIASGIWFDTIDGYKQKVADSGSVVSIKAKRGRKCQSQVSQ